MGFPFDAIQYPYCCHRWSMPFSNLSSNIGVGFGVGLDASPVGRTNVGVDVGVRVLVDVGGVMKIGVSVVIGVVDD